MALNPRKAVSAALPPAIDVCGGAYSVKPITLGAFALLERYRSPMLFPRGKPAETLDLLPAGAIPPNPSELIESQKMAQTVELLKSLDYDYIFFDSSPSLPVADATTFNRYVDANIFMLRAGVCDLKFVEDLDEAAANGNLKNVYIVLNGVDIKARSYGYHYGYGYGHYGYGKNKYGYGYGYGYGDKKKVGQTESAASETK